ncbi:hypothetical protein M569_04907, partial [Genlisea aurea]
LPSQFMWSEKDLAPAVDEHISDPPVDLSGFLDGDPDATRTAVDQIREACSSHGFFQVVNHGVGEALVREAHEQMEVVFRLPPGKKMSMKRKPGDLCGYSGAHADRFTANLPWKEMLSFHHAAVAGDDVVGYIKSVLGNEFEETGVVFQRYCEAMKKLSQAIFGLLSMSLGLDPTHYVDVFSDGNALMRINNYPPCPEAGLTFGTGPHTDPNALTILHQDLVGGLQVFADGKWRPVKPISGAFAVNIGDTFMAICNGRYKSCVHRAVVNKERERRSLVFFVNPRDDRLLRPPEELVSVGENPYRRWYPDFTWSQMREFTQKHYRVDSGTLASFVRWLGVNSS